ncbi:hypothetical protein HHI36_007279 [Cryptolaemus montrouzieri]|uniref:Uncharacterized protein n=1 Tax=Cryptolaemus montrouzieri TaxID=559131 RepID=A0ABD2MPD5_9CUCU
MPNPMKKFFRRPAVKRCKKVASRQFRKLFPERGFYDIAATRDPGEVPEWLSKRIRLEDAAYKHGLQPKPYRGRRHSFELQPQVAPHRGFRSFEGYMPPGQLCSSDDMSYSKSFSGSNMSALMSHESTYDDTCDSRGMDPCFQPPSVSTPTRSNVSAQRELMLTLDQLEMVEIERIQKDLRMFQTYRRRLMFNAASLSATSAPPAILMRPVEAAEEPPRALEPASSSCC